MTAPATSSSPIEAVKWSPDGRHVRIIDQRLLPAQLVELDLATVAEVRQAIAELAVRGAPAIGVCAAMGLAVSALGLTHLDRDAFLSAIDHNAKLIAGARPTAVNLAWAVDRVLAAARRDPATPASIAVSMHDEATRLLNEDRAMCDAIGTHGVSLLSSGSRILTHCNAGALATCGIGTALAPIYKGAELGLSLSVIASETRPLLQGSRLTAWELDRAGVEVAVATDGMVASLMAAQMVDIVIVGADRIAANGDFANKIGTYGVAILARHHGIPFYVAAPSSTIDSDTASGAGIRIEHRPSAEVTVMAGQRVAPAGVAVHNPAFDVTPAVLVTGFITDRGIVRPPFDFHRVPDLQ
ncbi:MAG: S-methyl-5-thioribose-1-phosphate isomerase [Gemmatimonadota bacterium]